MILLVAWSIRKSTEFIRLAFFPDRGVLDLDIHNRIDLSFLDGQVVLITGGTGSFGEAIIRCLLSYSSAAKVIVFSRDELKQYEMAQKYGCDSRLRFLLGDVRDLPRLMLAFKGVDSVIHAAAMKQVEAAEYNPMECIKTNVLGAENIVTAAINAGVKKVIALSTDKAASPLNLYGATKLVSDKIMTAANNLGGPTRFSVVRYGNVAGSRGSVIPYYRKLIAEGCRALPITDPRMTRFWITLDEGVAFVLRSLGGMRGGEMFIPKLPSVKVSDLVEALLGKGNYDVIGIRPGEKLHEVMIPYDDSRSCWEFPGYYSLIPANTHFNFEDFGSDLFGEQGIIPEEFEYRSDANRYFLSVEDLKAMLIE
jgi:UDP-N-acetylglucosamine 4,6-dehydratase